MELDKKYMKRSYLTMFHVFTVCHVLLLMWIISYFDLSLVKKLAIAGFGGATFALINFKIAIRYEFWQELVVDFSKDLKKFDQDID